MTVMVAGKVVLVTGGTGYVGGCLIPYLLERGYCVRVMVRNGNNLVKYPWREQVDIVSADLESPVDLNRAMRGVWTTYYLVHNMSSGRGYVNKEYESAHNFARAASDAGVEHIIYLGGLADPQARIGSHLRSRLRTGDALRQGSVPVTEFRASLIIGSGSISFEMIRYLTEQLPIAVGRRWILNRTQAISIRNILDYLLAALEQPDCRGKIYEIGGKDVLTYSETMMTYARLRGLKRAIIPLPWLPVKLMAFMAGQLTPVPATIAGPLIEGMRSDSIVHNDQARQDFPEIDILDFRTSILQALDKLSPHLEPIWENGSSSFRIRQEGFFAEAEKAHLPVPPEAAFQAVAALGGKQGWLYLNWLWRLRGFFDRLAGGPGLRGRVTDRPLKVGDVVDFYRVELLEPGARLRLIAELKAPGTGWMEWRIVPEPGGGSTVIQIAYFAPKGLAGYSYWYLLLPMHRLVFSGLIKAIARRAKEIHARSPEALSVY